MVKIILGIIIVIFFVMLVGVYMLGTMSKTGKPTGLLSGQLSPCPDTPNCVVSEIAEDDSHYISPIHYPASMAKDSMDIIKQIIQEVGGELTIERETYFAAAFTSTLFGFVDDLECRNDKGQHTLHLRSASRVGHSDFGANRKRVELISNIFGQRITKPIPKVLLFNTSSMGKS